MAWLDEIALSHPFLQARHRSTFVIKSEFDMLPRNVCFQGSTSLKHNEAMDTPNTPEFRNLQ